MCTLHDFLSNKIRFIHTSTGTGSHSCSEKNYAYASVHLEINCYFQYSIHVQVFFTDVNIHLATSNTSGDVSTSILRFGIAVDGVQLSNNDTSTNSTTTRVRRDVSSDAVGFEVELSVSKVNIHCTAQ